MSDGGGGAIEKLGLIALFVFASAVGVRYLGSTVRKGLECQGAVIRKADGTTVCASGDGMGPATSAGSPGAKAAPTSCRGNQCLCFVAGTPVMTSTGPRAIEEVQPGTLVLSRDEDGADLAWQPVVRVFESRSRSLVRLTLKDENERSDVVTTTPNHPFFAMGRGWVEAATLRQGQDLLVDGRGRPIFVQSAELQAQRAPVYNLEIAESHTYFAGQLGVWVHNMPLGRATKARMILGRPGNPVGRTVPIKIFVEGSVPIHTNATVVAKNADGSYWVEWRDADGNVCRGTSDGTGNVTPHPRADEVSPATSPQIGSAHPTPVSESQTNLGVEAPPTVDGAQVQSTLQAAPPDPIQDWLRWSDALDVPSPARVPHDIHLPLTPGQAAALGGMEPEHVERLSQSARRHNELIVVRASNPASLRHHNSPGASAKPVTDKRKTAKNGPYEGLVVDDQGRLVTTDDKSMHGDYDLQGVYDMSQTPPALVDTNRPEYPKRLNQEVSPRKPYFMHGANDNYLAKDAFDQPQWSPEIGTYLRGRQPDADEKYVIFEPSGDVRVAHSTAELQQYYERTRILWPYQPYYEAVETPASAAGGCG